MGNFCFDSIVRAKPMTFELSYDDFKSIFKSMRLPKKVAITSDSRISRLQNTLTAQFYILKQFVFTSEKELAAFVMNLRKVAYLEHDNILKIYHYSIERKQLDCESPSFILNIILENFHHTLQDELRSRAKGNINFTDEGIRKFMNKIIDTLEFLQLKGMSLGHLRPSNIYVTSDKQPKLMFLGDVQSLTNENCFPDASSLNYLSPEMRQQVAESLFPEKMHSLTLLSPVLSPVAVNSYRADVFSFGLILVEMMSLKSIEGLNAPFSESIRRYRVIQCKDFGPLIQNMVDAMLTENELNRPDFMDLKKMIMMEEYRESTRESRRETKGSQIEDWKGFIEMKTMQNHSKAKRKDYSEVSSEYEDMSSDVEDESIMGNGGEQDLEESFNVRLQVKGTKKVSNAHMQVLEDLQSSETMLVNSQKRLKEAIDNKVETLKRLTINFEENQITNEIFSEISKLISWQSNLSELMLCLSKNKLDDGGLSMIFDGVDKLKNLTLCYFDFRKTKISSAGLKRIGESVSEKPGLIQLALNVADNLITSNECQDLTSCLEKLRNLKSLAINLGGNDLQEEGVVALGKLLGKLENLESLMLLLYSNNIEGNESLTTILAAMSKMKNLKKIKLDLSSNLLGDEEMEMVAKFAKESNVEDVIIELKDNCVAREGKNKVITECALKENIDIRF